MNKMIQRLALFATGCIALANPAVALTVRVNWQTKTSFSEFKTYVWKVSKRQGNDF